MEVYRNLIVKDSEYHIAGNEFKAYFDILENVIIQYKTILNQISNTSISSGATHDAIIRYNEYIEKLELVVKEFGKKCKSLTSNYIREIESADDYLYDAEICEQVRNFTSEEEERLLKCLDDPWCIYTDSFGDWIYSKILSVGDAFNFDGVRAWLQKSHRCLLDYNDETADGLRNLFIRVYAIERKHGESKAGIVPGSEDLYTCHFDYMYLTAIHIRDMINAMADIIDPEKGMFTVANINDKLGGAYKELMHYYNQTMEIKEMNQKPTISEISDFAKKSWSELFFSNFGLIMSDFLADIGGIDTLKMVVFNMFDIAAEKIIPGRYEVQVAKKQLLDAIENIVEDYSLPKGIEKEIIDNCNTFLGYVEKYGDKWYEHLEYTQKTKAAQEFAEFLEGLGGAQNNLKYGGKGIEYISRLFVDYKEGLQIIESFKKNYLEDNDIVQNAIAQVQALYNKEFKAWAVEAIESVYEVGIDIALDCLGEVDPVTAVVNKIGDGIEIVGEVTGIGSRAQSLYDFLTYNQLYHSSQSAYNNALNAFKVADPNNSEEYEILARDLENCFNLHKRNVIETFNLMAGASAGMKQSYYKYCVKQAERLTMYDMKKPNLLSYDEFLAIG